MRYLLLIYGDETAQASEAEMAAIFQAYSAFDQEVSQKGVKLGGSAASLTAKSTAWG